MKPVVSADKAAGYILHYKPAPGRTSLVKYIHDAASLEMQHMLPLNGVQFRPAFTVSVYTSNNWKLVLPIIRVYIYLSKDNRAGSVRISYQHTIAETF